MSDSEYCGYEKLFQEEERPVSTKKGQKKRVYSNRSDSEETVVLKEVKKRKPAAPKKSVKTKEAHGVNDPFDLFGLVTAEESVAVLHSQANSELPPVLNSRVANGIVSRRKPADGEFYVEVKVYRTRDAASTRPEERWRKALTSLKIQMNSDEVEWGQLQDFFKTIRKSMNDVEPVFYGNKAD